MPAPTENRFDRVRQILDAAVGGSPVHGHGPFWRGVSRDQFVQLVKLGLPVVTVGDGPGSNLVKALRGQAPFGADVDVPAAGFPRMPKGLPPVLCGLLNDGLFRGRFHVEGYAATDAGRDAVFAFAQQVPDAELSAELRRRYVRSQP